METIKQLFYEKGDEMRDFLQRSSSAGMVEISNVDGVRVSYKSTELYLEFETVIDDVHLVWYVMQMDEVTFVIAAYFDDIEDIFQAAKGGNIEIEDILETYPSFNVLLKNAAAEKYSECALVRDSDLDTGDASWFVITMLKNVKIESVRDFFCGRSRETVERLICTSLSLREELNTNEISLLKAAWRGVKRGVWFGLKASSDQLLGSLLGGVAGVLAGTNQTYVQALRASFEKDAERGAEKILQQLQS